MGENGREEPSATYDSQLGGGTWMPHWSELDHLRSNMLITLAWIAFGVGSIFAVGAVLGCVAIMLAAGDWPHDTSRHTGWEDR